MRSFRGVRQALYWFFNDSDKGFAPSVTGGIIEAIKSGAVKPQKSPWRVYKAVRAGYVCDKCSRRVKKGEPGTEYLMTRSKKAGGNVHQRYCEACGEMMLDLAGKYVRGIGEHFGATRQLEEAVVGRTDFKRMMAQLPAFERGVLKEVSQADTRDMANVYAYVRNYGMRLMSGKSDLTIRRCVHDVLARFEATLREGDYIEGAGDYGA